VKLAFGAFPVEPDINRSVDAMEGAARWVDERDLAGQIRSSAEEPAAPPRPVCQCFLSGSTDIAADACFLLASTDIATRDDCPAITQK
jgi:hypothetical protein